MSKAKDFTGQRFGRLVAIKPTDKRATDKSIVWLLRCDCGNLHEASSTNLLSGNTQSCGCYANEQTSKRFKKNIIGQKFGQLTVIKDSNKKYRNNVIWECKCDCGNMCERISSNLLRGLTKSCGCIKQKAAMKGLIKMQTPESKEKSKISNGEIDHTRVTALTKKIRKDNKSGVNGVCYSNTEQIWKAQIDFKKRHYDLGRYKNKDEAIKVRKQAEEMLFEPFLEWYYDKFPSKKTK